MQLWVTYLEYYPKPQIQLGAIFSVTTLTPEHYYLWVSLVAVFVALIQICSINPDLRFGFVCIICSHIANVIFSDGMLCLYSKEFSATVCMLY